MTSIKSLGKKRHRTAFSKTSYTSVISLLAAAVIIAVYIPLNFPIKIVGTTFYLSIERIFIILMGLLTLAFITRERKIYFTKSTFALFLLVFILTASGLWSFYPGNTLNRMFDLSFHLVYYLAIISIPTEEISMANWYRIILLGCGVTIIIYSLAFFSEIYDTADLQNHAARRFSIFIPMALAYAATTRSKKTALALYSLIIYTSVMTLRSGSRSGLIVLLFLFPFLFAILYISDHQKHVNFIIKIIPVIVFCLLLFEVIAGIRFLPVNFKIPTSPSSITPEVIGVQRFRIYSLFYSLIQDYWFFGIGFASFRRVMGEIYTTSFVMHGIYFRIWIGAGIAGLGTFLYLCLSSAREYLGSAVGYYSLGDRTNAAMTLATVSGFIALLVSGIFQPILYNPLLMLLFAISHLTVRNWAAHSTS